VLKFRKAAYLAVLVTAFVSSARAQGTYKVVRVQGAVSTYCWGINSAGDVVGFYSDGSHSHGFLASGGTITTFDKVGATDTYARGINDLGQIVGSTDTNGFLYDISTGVFTTLQYPRDGSRTFPYSINNAGTITGYIVIAGERVGFELNGTTYTTTRAPGSFGTVLSSINNQGDALVQGLDETGFITSAYLRRQGKMTKLDISSGRYPFAINDANAVVGFRGPVHYGFEGFVQQDNLQESLKVHGSAGTLAFAINNSGTVAGWYLDKNDVNDVGFIWTPPVDAEKK